MIFWKLKGSENRFGKCNFIKRISSVSFSGKLSVIQHVMNARIIA